MRRKTPTITILNPEDFAQLLPTASTNKVSSKNFDFVLLKRLLSYCEFFGRSRKFIPAKSFIGGHSQNIDL